MRAWAELVPQPKSASTMNHLALGVVSQAVELDREARVTRVSEHAFVDRPRASRPVAWRWLSANGLIHTSRQAGGTTSDLMRASFPASRILLPFESR